MARITAFFGSIRSREKKEWILRAHEWSSVFESAYDYVYGLSLTGKICNSDGMMLMAIAGAMEQGCEVASYQGSVQKGWIDKPVKESQGFIFGTPVYFGEYSSIIQTTFDALMKMTDPYPLNGKVAGFVSVGAKRNGGQETANLIGLHRCFELGANVVGNGPPICQSGGTGVGGNPGSIRDDTYGLQTAYELGRRVGTLAGDKKWIAAGKPRISVVYRGIPSDGVVKYIERVFPNTNADFDPLYFSDISFQPCMGCNTCPGREDGGCRQNNELDTIRNTFMNSDGILFVESGVVRSFANEQAFQERTRFMRRNHFELSNIPMGFIHFGTDPLFLLRGIQYTQRQNAIAIGPGHWMHSHDGYYLEQYLSHFVQQVKRYRSLRQNNQRSFYEAVGY